MADTVGGISTIYTARASPRSQNPEDNDGMIIGTNGKAYTPGTPLSTIAPVMPTRGANLTDAHVSILMNGIATKADEFDQMVKDIANTTHVAFYGIHEGSKNLVRDAWEAQGQIGNLTATPASRSMAMLIVNEVQRGTLLDLYAHSQGALDLASALDLAQRKLEDLAASNLTLRAQLDAGNGKQGKDKVTGVEGVFQKLIRVTTFGGAAWSYPHGPRYVHYVNERDLVIGSGMSPEALANLDGFEQAFVKFSDARGHSFTNAFLPHWMPFEKAWATAKAAAEQTTTDGFER